MMDTKSRCRLAAIRTDCVPSFVACALIALVFLLVCSGNPAWAEDERDTDESLLQELSVTDATAVTAGIETMQDATDVSHDADESHALSVASASYSSWFTTSNGTTGASAVDSGTALSYGVISGTSDVAVAVNSASGWGFACDPTYAGSIVVPEKVQHDGIEYTVVGIADDAFSVQKDTIATPASTCNITSIVIPDTVTSIGTFAFAYCKALKSVTIGANSQLASIGSYAFYHAEALDSFYLPAALASLGKGAFSQCASIARDGSGNVIKDSDGNFVFSSGLKTVTADENCKLALIPEMCFNGCYMLTTVAVPKTVTAIGKKAFFNCYGLTAVSIPDDSGLTAIGAQAFMLTLSQSHLASIVLPASLASIGEYAFYNQRTLADLQIRASSLDSIGQYAFGCCVSLVSISLPTITATTNGLGKHLFDGCTGLRTCVFQGEIASDNMTDGSSWDGSLTFSGCTALDTVVYYGPKYIPSYHPLHWHNQFPPVYYGFPDSDPTLYYTVTFYACAQDAREGASPLGTITVRAGTELRSIRQGLPASDGNGTVIYRGSVPDYPAGCDGWAFQDGASQASAIDDSLYAYAVDSHDLSTGSVGLSATTLDYTGNAAKPSIEVVASDGATLAEGVDYDLSFQRQTSDGSWADTADFVTCGTVRVTAVGKGTRYGSASNSYTIGYTQVGSTFTDDQGIVYKVLTAYDGTNVPTVQVGNGTDPACDTGRTDAVSIASTVSPSGSQVGYTVVAVGDYAFGADTPADSTNLTSITLPDTVTSIGTCAFRCSGIKTMTIPAAATTVGARAFQGCTKLKTLAFAGEGMQSIGSYAFEGCLSLSTLELPSFAPDATVAEFAFADCTNVSTVIFRGTVPAVGADNQFSGSTSILRVCYGDAEWGGTFPTKDTCDVFFDVKFYASVDAYEKEAEPLSRAFVLKGTTLSKIDASLGSGWIYSGSIPDNPISRGSWRFGLSGTSLDHATYAYAYPLNYLTVSSVDTVYDGLPHTAQATARFADSQMYYSQDNGVTWSSVAPALTHVGSVTFKVKALNAAQGDSEIETVHVTITALDISAATIAPVSGMTYTGSPLMPSVAVSSGTLTLVEGTDYVLSYADNVQVGTASIAITGSGDCTGTAHVAFAIVPASSGAGESAGNGSSGAGSTSAGDSGTSSGSGSAAGSIAEAAPTIIGGSKPTTANGDSILAALPELARSLTSGTAVASTSSLNPYLASGNGVSSVASVDSGMLLTQLESQGTVTPARLRYEWLLERLKDLRVKNALLPIVSGMGSQSGLAEIRWSTSTGDVSECQVLLVGDGSQGHFTLFDRYRYLMGEVEGERGVRLVMRAMNNLSSTVINTLFVRWNDRAECADGTSRCYVLNGSSASISSSSKDYRVSSGNWTNAVDTLDLIGILSKLGSEA